MKTGKLFLILISLNLFTLYAEGTTDPMRQKIYKVIKNKKATVGVAFLSDDKLFTLNDRQKYPLMSVFKFHVAFCALKKMESEHTSLKNRVGITSSQMHKDTYSPLRELYPNQDFCLSFEDLLRFCISESDNNACDILIDYIGGIEKVDKQMKSIGLTDYNLSETEATMHSDITNCYKNWSTPSSMVKLLYKVYNEKLLNTPYDVFLEQIMIETTTGSNKMREGIPANIILGHKTGSSDRLNDGTKIGDNDAGVIYLPNDKKCFIAIFIKDSQETDSTNTQIIAGITEIIYQAFCSSES
ncbi:MAG: class A beta-lactamase [Bacteroidales bacterium]|nr:class A beta-lactamase [Bacteroidales bacterium]